MILRRIRNLWELSSYQPLQPKENYPIPTLVKSEILKKNVKEFAQFIPRTKQKDIDKVNAATS